MYSINYLSRINQMDFIKNLLKVIWLLPGIIRPEEVQRNHRLKFKETIENLLQHKNVKEKQNYWKHQQSWEAHIKKPGENQISDEETAQLKHGISVLLAEIWVGGWSGKSYKKINNFVGLQSRCSGIVHADDGIHLMDCRHFSWNCCPGLPL